MNITLHKIKALDLPSQDNMMESKLLELITVLFAVQNYLVQKLNTIQVQAGLVFGNRCQIMTLKLNPITRKEWLERKFIVVSVRRILAMFFQTVHNPQVRGIASTLFLWI